MPSVDQGSAETLDEGHCADLQAQRLQAQAQQIEQAMNEARTQGYEQGLAEGREVGFKQGLEQGRTQGLAEARPLVDEQLAQAAQSVRALVGETEASLEHLNEELGQAILMMGLRVAERLVGAALHAPDDLLATALTATLKSLDSPLRITVTGHPQQLERLRQAVASTIHADATWQWEPDESLGMLDYRVHTNIGDIDARLRTRWRAACESLGLGPVGAAGLALPGDEASS